MKNAVNSIKQSLQKRHEALEQHRARRTAFLIAQKQIVKEIEDAKRTWNKQH